MKSNNEKEIYRNLYIFSISNMVKSSNVLRNIIKTKSSLTKMKIGVANGQKIRFWVNIR